MMNNMNFCINCGEKRIENSNYCFKCGLKYENKIEPENQFVNKATQSSSDSSKEKREKEDSQNVVFEKILCFFNNINGKQLLIYNICNYFVGYCFGYYIASTFGLNNNTFVFILIVDILLGGCGYWFRSKQFQNGKLIFIIWVIGLIIFDIIQVNEVLFKFELLKEFKYLHLLFLTPTSWYLILSNNPKAKIKGAI